MLPWRRPPTRLLNYDVVLNVELVVHIHDVDLNALTGRPASLGLILRRRWPSSIGCTATCLHISWNDSLHMEELLVVLPALLILQTLPTISLVLDVLSRVRATNCATHPAIPSASWLRRRLVVPLEHLWLVEYASSILVHVRAALEGLVHVALHALLIAGLKRLRVAITVVHKALVSIAGSLFHPAFKHITVLDVLDLFVGTPGNAWDLRLLVLTANRCPNISDVTVLVIRGSLVGCNACLLKLRISGVFLLL